MEPNSRIRILIVRSNLLFYQEQQTVCRASFITPFFRSETVAMRLRAANRQFISSESVDRAKPQLQKNVPMRKLPLPSDTFQGGRSIGTSSISSQNGKNVGGLVNSRLTGEDFTCMCHITSWSWLVPCAVLY